MMMKFGAVVTPRKFVLGIRTNDAGVLYADDVPAQYRFTFPEERLSRNKYVPAIWSACDDTIFTLSTSVISKTENLFPENPDKAYCTAAVVSGEVKMRASLIPTSCCVYSISSQFI